MNSENIWKHGRKESWIVIRFGKYGRKISWIVKRYRKYRRKLWNDMENTEESKLNSEKIGKIWKKTVKWYGKYGRKANTEENCEKIWKIWKKPKLNSEKRLKTWKKRKLNSDRI